MKKFWKVTLAMVLVIALLAGCGASSMVADRAPAMKNEIAVESPAAPMLEYAMDSVTGVSGAGQSVPGVEDLEALLPQISSKIVALGGYVENQDLYNGSSYSSYRSRSANLTIRVPAENLNGFVEDVKGVSNVVSYNESTENVTLQYVSTESRMKALEVEQQRLLELLAKAENMSDLLEIEARLTDVRYELESVTSQLRVLANQVDYATIYLYISQVKVYTETEEQTVWQRIASGFQENLRDMGEDLTDFFVWVITYSPQMILWAVIIAVAATVLKRKFAKKKVSRKPIQEKTEEQ